MPDDTGIVLPDGTEPESEKQEALTERGQERLEEEKSCQPVIVKRTDEIRRHPDDMITSAVCEGLEQLDRSAMSLGLSALAAGLILGFTAMAVAVMTQAAANSGSSLVLRVAPAMVYPLGFVVCIMSGAQLFTEHTATAVYPLFERKVSALLVARLWTIVILGNLVGTASSAGLLSLADPVIQARMGYETVAHHLVTFDTKPLLVSAVLAGWLMALGAWLTLASPSALAQIVLIFAVTFLIGLGGLHHSIAGSAEMFAALWVSEEFTMAQAFRFVGLALAGNAIGGSCFVAALNYVHIRRTQTVEESQAEIGKW